METDAIPKSAGREPDRDTQIAERLRRVTQMRRAAVEAARLAQAPQQRRIRLTVLCTVAILVLGTIFALYRYIQNNSLSHKLYKAGLYPEPCALTVEELVENI